MYLVFNIYVVSIKYGERVRRQKATAINIITESADQLLPVTMESF